MTSGAAGSTQPMKTLEWILIGILSVLWGGSFFFIGVAVRELPPFTIVGCRVGLAAAVLLVYVHATGRRMPTSLSTWGAFMVMGLLNNFIPFSLIVWGQRHIDSSLAAILNATTPIFGVVLAHFFTRDEKLTPHRVIGVLLGWIGVAALIGFDSFRGATLQVAGQSAVLVAAGFYACAAIFGRRFRGMPPVVVAAGMLTAATIMMTPVALVVDRPWQLSAGWVTWAAIAGLALVSTALAFIIYFRVLASAGTNILLVTFLIPVSALALGVFILGETPGWNTLAGMVLILSGLAVIDGRLPAAIQSLRGAGPVVVVNDRR